MVSPTKKILLTTLLVNAARVLLAIVFMVSGFVKAVDPVGFMYKLKEYYGVFGTVEVSDSWFLFFAILLCGVEFVAGFFLLAGVWRRLVAVITFLMLLFYTPVTLYIALESPVLDCGCFGEAFQLTNWETFIKNVLLLLLSAVVCFKNGFYRRCVSDKNRWMVVIFALLYVVMLEGVSVFHLPVIDFRPYAIGTDLREAVKDVPAKYDAVYVYEKNGEQRDFAADALPDSTWSYIGSRTKLVEAGRAALASDFCFLDRAGGDDVADRILSDTGYVALVVIESIENADESRVDKINDLYDYSKGGAIAFYAASSSTDEAVEQWRKRTGAEYPILWADDIMLKTIVRANPGLLLVKDGKVVEKRNINDVPDIDYIAQEASLGAWNDYIGVMRGWEFWLLLFAVPVAVLLFLDMFAAPSKKKRK